MTIHERSLRLPGTIDQVRSACDFVVEVARSAGLSDDGIFQCQLSVEEIFTNIVEHGYHYDGAGKVIEIVCQLTEDRLIISIIDEAPPFNPLTEVGESDPTASLWDREDGGWGVFFVQKYMDDIRYRLENDRNHLILEKRLEQQ